MAIQEAPVRRLSLKDRIIRCCNISTIILLVVVFAMNWAFRMYCLKNPVDWSPLEWKPIIWIVFDATITFFILRLGSGWFCIPSVLFVSVTWTAHLVTSYFYRHMLYYGQLASVFETNADETVEYIQFVGFYPFIAFFALLILFGVLAFNASRIGWKGITILLGVSLYPVISIAIPAMMGERNQEAYEFANFPAEKLKQRFVNSTVFRIPTMVGQYISIHSRMISAAYRQRILPEGIKYHQMSGNPEIPRRIVFVLGESDWRKHHGAYGYALGVDRFMMARKLNPKNTVFVDAISPASVTRDAISREFTFATPQDIKPFNENTGIIDMARKAGYQTAWFSRQNWNGIYDTLVKIVAQQADETVYYDKGHDEVLVPPLLNAVKHGKRQFLVIHIWGSHLGYGERYDALDYSLAFRTSKEFRRYDATIAHTDRVLKAVNQCADEHTLFIYMPDHGEVINKGHGFPEMFASQFEIPLIAWSDNSRYVARFKQVVQKYAITINKSKLFNTSALPFVMAELMGYYVDDKVRAKSKEDSHYIFNVDGYAYPISALR